MFSPQSRCFFVDWGEFSFDLELSVAKLVVQLLLTRQGMKRSCAEDVSPELNNLRAAGERCCSIRFSYSGLNMFDFFWDVCWARVCKCVMISLYLFHRTSGSDLLLANLVQPPHWPLYFLRWLTENLQRFANAPTPAGDRLLVRKVPCAEDDDLVRKFVSGSTVG